jgi:hypothetical protein
MMLQDSSQQGCPAQESARAGREEMDVFIASADAIQAAVMDPNGVCLYTASDEQGQLFFKAEDVMDAVWTAHDARTQ